MLRPVDPGFGIRPVGDRYHSLRSAQLVNECYRDITPANTRQLIPYPHD